METKSFNGKRILIRKISQKDLENVKKFQVFINFFIEEDAKILRDKKVSLKEEKEWLKGLLQRIKKREEVYLLATSDDEIVGTAAIQLGLRRQNHVGNLGISIINGYRGIGLGTHMMKEIIKLAKKELRPKPKIIKLTVFPGNKSALALYKKLGFRRVAKIPKQFQYKGKLEDEIVMLLYL